MTEAHFGVTVPQIKRPWVAAAQAARAFEDMGYDSLWVCDHFYGPQSPNCRFSRRGPWYRHSPRSRNASRSGRS